jgi:hypothetical protein
MSTSRRSHLADIEADSKPPFYLTYPEVKLLGIAGVRFPMMPLSLLLTVLPKGWFLP